jgi:hypothetical protein
VVARDIRNLADEEAMQLVGVTREPRGGARASSERPLIRVPL